MIIESNRSGHRLGYAKYFSNLLADSKIVYLFDESKKNVFLKAVFSPKLLLSTADDYLFFSFCLCIVRVLLFKQTKIILIRVEHVLDHRGIKVCIKWLFYRALKALPYVYSFSIMPHWVEPRLTYLTNGYIYDPAFFELDLMEGLLDKKVNPYGQTLVKNQLPHNVIYLGVVSEVRNIRAYLDLFSKRPEVKALALGRHAVNLSEKAIANPGYVTMCNKHLNNLAYAKMFISIQSVWCAFRSDYDNFSGVFCNVIRFQTPVWLTKGSRLEQFVKMQGGEAIYSIDSKTGTFILYARIQFDIETIRKYNENELK